MVAKCNCQAIGKDLIPEKYATEKMSFVAKNRNLVLSLGGGLIAYPFS